MFQSARIFQFNLALNYPLPLKGSTVEWREGLILELIDNNDRRFYGECSPLPDFSCETIDQALAQLKAVCEQLIRGETIADMRLFPSVAFAVESALWFAENRAGKRSTLQDSPLLIGGVSAIEQRLINWLGPWPAEFKLKVAREELQEDICRVTKVLNLIPDQTKLRLDANQRWTLEQSCQFADAIPVGKISYIEEPTPDYREFESIYLQTGMGFALDETVQAKEYRFSAMRGLKALVIKPTLVGGISRCCELAEQADQQGVRVIFSSSFESHLGVDIIRQLSNQLSPNEAPGLDTLSAFKHGFCQSLPEKGMSLSESAINAMELKWIYDVAH